MKGATFREVTRHSIARPSALDYDLSHIGR